MNKFIFAVIFGLILTSGLVSAAVDDVIVRTTSHSYTIWPSATNGWENVLGSITQVGQKVTVEVLVTNDIDGRGVNGENVNITVKDVNGANQHSIIVTTNAAGYANTTFWIDYTYANGTWNVSAIAQSNSLSDSYNFQVDRLKCNNCHGYPAAGHKKTCSEDCGHNSMHASLDPNDGQSKAPHDWGTSGAPSCMDCHGTLQSGKHDMNEAGESGRLGIDGAGCGVGPGLDGTGTCHGAIVNADTLDPDTNSYVDITYHPALAGDTICVNCHTNTSSGDVTSESAPNANTWSDLKDHENYAGQSRVACSSCHNGAHDLNLIVPGNSDINAQCDTCHDEVTTKDYRGPDCKGCHYNDTNNNGYLDPSPGVDYTGAHAKDLNPNYVWDSDDATPEDNDDDQTDATYPGGTITSDASGFRASQSINVKLLDADDTLAGPRATWGLNTNGTGDWSDLTSYTVLSEDATGVWKYYVSTDGGTTYVMYDRFTVSAEPEFPLGASVALGASMLIYVWRRRKYKA